LQGPAYDARLSGFPYPFEVHTFDFESQRQPLQMAYMDVKPAQPNGRTVVLLHGKNFSGAYWAPTARSLSGLGYRVVIPDQIGFGKSTKPRCYQFTLQGLAQNTRRLLDSLGIGKVSVVGHSMGGMMAARFALMFPDRVEKVALVDPIGLEDWQRYERHPTVDKLFAHEQKTTPDSIREYMRTSYFGGEWKPDYEPLVDMLAGWTRGPDRTRIAWDAALTTEMILTQPVVHELPDLKAPTLLIVGEQDRTVVGKPFVRPEFKGQLGNYPELGKRMAAAIPHCTLVEIPGVGHLPQIQAFDTYFQALRAFLGSPDRRRPPRLGAWPVSAQSSASFFSCSPVPRGQARPAADSACAVRSGSASIPRRED
jgi:pimeloyl-ACP methyl ester carboxylesterase